MIKQGSATVVTALLIASCSNAAGITTTTVAGAPPASAVPTAAISPTTIPTPPPTTSMPSTTTGSATVGSPAALEALMTRVIREEVGADNIGDLSEVPVLDVNNPDPTAALLSNVAFEDWAYKTFPDQGWADVLTVADSPAFLSYRTQFDSEGAAFVRWEDVGEPFTVVSIEFPDIVPLAQSVLDDLPEDSVTFLLDTSRGAYRKVRIDTGDVVEERPGWDSIMLVVVMAPMSVGWQVYLSEVVDG